VKDQLFTSRRAPTNRRDQKKAARRLAGSLCENRINGNNKPFPETYYLQAGAQAVSSRQVLSTLLREEL
jgi:hypothetical protein